MVGRSGLHWAVWTVDHLADLTVAPRAALKAVRWVVQKAACSADLWVASRAEN